jgi:Flp pilus assembly protein TadB
MAWSTRSDGMRIVRALLVSYQRHGGSTSSSLAQSQSTLTRILLQADVDAAWLQRRVVLVVAVACGALLAGGFRVGGVVALLGALAVSTIIWMRARRNRNALDRDLPALLTSVASSVRAGIDPLSALIGARDYFPKESIIVREIEKLRRGIAEGRDEEELIEEFLALYGNQDGELFKRCLILSRRHGGSLGDPLHRITRVVRQRQSFRRKTRAALAMHRMSAIGIALCAVAMTALQCAMSPDSLNLAIHHPLGSKLLIGGVMTIISGLSWMLTMGREAKLQ